jgi:hypothetical protein
MAGLKGRDDVASPGPQPWLRRLPPGTWLGAGAVAPEPLRIAVDDARGLLRHCAREAAGVPAEAAQVVWATTTEQLLVRLDGVDLACALGLVTVTVPVACDQVPAGAGAGVVFGVGAPDKPAGLIMSTVYRPSGPDVIVDAWGEALTAFAWECLLRVAVTASAAVGTDAAGASLVPALVAADRDVLLVTPMARHRARLVARAGPVTAAPMLARSWPS